MMMAMMRHLLLDSGPPPRGESQGEFDFSSNPIREEDLWFDEKSRERARAASMARREATIQARFEEFHRKNPHIWRELQRRAARLLEASGRIGIAAIFESMRYDSAVRTISGDYKLNDNYTSRYARKLLAEHPEYRPVIEVRALRSP